MTAMQIAMAFNGLCEVALCDDRAAAKTIGEALPPEAKAVGKQIWALLRAQVARDELMLIASGLRGRLEKERDDGATR